MGAIASDRLARYVELIGDPAFIDLLCQRMGCGETLSQICASLQVPYSKVLYWLMDDDERYKRYERALVALSRYEVDEARMIADDVGEAVDAVQVAAAKLRIDTRFRRAKSHAPKEYGENSGEKGGGKLQVVLVDFRREENVPAGRVVEAVRPRISQEK